MNAPHVMTHEQAAAYREQYRKATAQWGGEVFQHFAIDEARQHHLGEVKALQDSGKVPF